MTTTLTSDEREQRRRAWLLTLHDSDCFYVTHNGACDCAEGVVAARAATQMRERCIESLRKLLEREVNGHCRGAYQRAITALESVTLDTEKK